MKSISLLGIVIGTLIGSAALVTAAAFYASGINVSWVVPEPEPAKVYAYTVNGTIGDIFLNLGSITTNQTRLYNLTNTGNTAEYIHITADPGVTVLTQTLEPWATVNLAKDGTIWFQVRVTPGEPGIYSATVHILADGNP